MHGRAEELRLRADRGRRGEDDRAEHPEHRQGGAAVDDHAASLSAAPARAASADAPTAIASHVIGSSKKPL